VGAAVGFAWGIGQAIGGFIDDKIQGKSRSAGEYFGIVARNTAGGALIGASIDATVLTGGLGAAAVGGLGGAGFELLTFSGQTEGVGETLTNAAKAGAIGAIGGVVLSKVAPVIGRGLDWAVERSPLLQKAGETIVERGSQVIGKAGQLATKVASRYEGGELGQILSRAANPFESLVGKPLSAGTATAATIAEGSGASGTTQAVVKPAVTSAPPMSPGARLRAQYGDTFKEYLRHRGQGFTPAQSKYLTTPYETGAGHHLVPQRLGRDYGISRELIDSRFNVMKPPGITYGQFYERHFLADPSFKATAFPRRIGGVWRGKDIGLVKPGFFGRLEYAASDPLKALASGWGGAVAAQTLMRDEEQD